MSSPAALEAPKRRFRLGLEGLSPAQLDCWMGHATVERKTTGSSIPCELRYLTEGELPQLVALQDAVYRDLPNKDLFRPVSMERHALYLRRRGRSAGAFLDGRLIAYSAVQFPVPYEENQGREIGFPEAALASVCQMEGIVVDPEFRGHRISRLLNEMRLCYALASGYPLAVATISPFNRYSLMSFVPTGLLVKGLREGSGSNLRYLVSDALDCDAVPVNEEVITVETSQLDRQKELLRQGYWGFRPLATPAGLFMQYARFHLTPRLTELPRLRVGER